MLGFFSNKDVLNEEVGLGIVGLTLNIFSFLFSTIVCNRKHQKFIMVRLTDFPLQPSSIGKIPIENLYFIPRHFTKGQNIKVMATPSSLAKSFFGVQYYLHVLHKSKGGVHEVWGGLTWTKKFKSAEIWGQKVDHPVFFIPQNCF